MPMQHRLACRAIVVAAVVVTAAACTMPGSGHLPGHPDGGRPLTNEDDGARIIVARGGTVVVRLRNSSPMTRWPTPTSSEPTVVALVSSREIPGGGVHATFRAESTGEAVLTSTLECLPDTPGGQVCNLFPVPWDVTVSVTD
jgi:hypothetical protein